MERAADGVHTGAEEITPERFSRRERHCVERAVEVPPSISEVSRQRVELVGLGEVNFEQRHGDPKVGRSGLGALTVAAEHRERDFTAVSEHRLGRSERDGIRGDKASDEDPFAIQQLRHEPTIPNWRSTQPRLTRCCHGESGPGRATSQIHSFSTS